jgi:hypothetical protein
LTAFVPYQILPSGSQRWSISIQSADFSAATVSMTKAGVTIATPVLPVVHFIYGDDTLVWQVTGISYGAPAQDEAYSVTVANVMIGTTPSTFSYTVTVIDPARPAPPSAPGNLRIIR